MSLITNPFPLREGRQATCMEMLQLILDGEATSEQKNYFKAHMDGCMPCLKNYEVDIAIKQMLQNKCCGGSAPPELIDKIRDKLKQA